MDTVNILGGFSLTDKAGHTYTGTARRFKIGLNHVSFEFKPLFAKALYSQYKTDKSLYNAERKQYKALTVVIARESIVSCSVRGSQKRNFRTCPCCGSVRNTRGKLFTVKGLKAHIRMAHGSMAEASQKVARETPTRQAPELTPEQTQSVHDARIRHAEPRAKSTAELTQAQARVRGIDTLNNTVKMTPDQASRRYKAYAEAL